MFWKSAQPYNRLWWNYFCFIDDIVPGKQCVWRQISGRLQADWEKGYIKISKNKSGSNQNQYSVQYLPSGVIKKINDGELEVLGHEDGVPTLLFGENQTVGGQVPTIWAEKAFCKNTQPASTGCRTQGVWAQPNKHFATQKWRLYRQKPCLPQQCVLFVRNL